MDGILLRSLCLTEEVPSCAACAAQTVSIVCYLLTKVYLASLPSVISNYSMRENISQVVCISFVYVEIEMQIEIVVKIRNLSFTGDLCVHLRKHFL